MSVDKTLSELYSISDHEDENVRKVVEIVISRVKGLQKQIETQAYNIREYSDIVERLLKMRGDL